MAIAALSELIARLGSLSEAADRAAKSLRGGKAAGEDAAEKTKKGAGQFFTSFRSAAIAVGAFTGVLLKSVSAYSPATIDRFSRAVDDAWAALGYSLMPVLEEATRWVHNFGSAILEAMPSQQEVKDAMRALRPAIDDLLKVIKESAREIGKITSALIEFFGTIGHAYVTFRSVTDSVRGFAASLTGFLDPLREWWRELYNSNVAIRIFVRALDWATVGLTSFGRWLFGFTTGGQTARFSKPRSAVGLAARPAQIISIPELGRRNIESVLSGGASLPQQQLEAQRQGNEFLGSVAAQIDAIRKMLEDAVRR